MLLKNSQDTSLPNSYQSISMTPRLVRLIERLVLSRVQVHLKVNNIIVKNQQGFRKAIQTKGNLLYIVQNGQEAVNLDEKAFTIMFVVTPFDQVKHNRLIHKFVELKVPYNIIMVMINFLKDLTFSVRMEEKDSEIYIIIFGIPQGGVLSRGRFDIPIKM
jgi:hypothetical protein